MKNILTFISLLFLVGLGVLVWQEPHALLSVPLGLLKFFIAAMVLNLVLRVMDHVNGLSFKTFAATASEKPMAMAIYYSARLIIVGLLAIACLS